MWTLCVGFCRINIGRANNNSGSITLEARLCCTVWIVNFWVFGCIWRWLRWAQSKRWNESRPPASIAWLCIAFLWCNIAIAATRTWIRVCDLCWTIPCDGITECIKDERYVVTPWTKVPVSITPIKCIGKCAPFVTTERIDWLRMFRGIVNYDFNFHHIFWHNIASNDRQWGIA